MHLAENTVKLTVTCVKFNYRPTVDALHITQGEWRKQQPGGDPVGNSKHKSQWPEPLPSAGILPSHSPPTLQSGSWSLITDTFHASLSSSVHSGQ